MDLRVQLETGNRWRENTIFAEIHTQMWNQVLD